MSWSSVQIGDFLKERKGRFKPVDANSMGLKRVEKIDFSGNIYVTEKTTNTDMILVKHGDLLISGINVEKGAIAVYEGKADILATIHYSSYEYDKKQINVNYLKWFLISDTFKNLLKESAGGGIKTELKAKHLLPLKIQLPSIEKQKEIITIVNKQSHNIGQVASDITQQQTYLTQLRQAILQDAVMGKLVTQNKNDEHGNVLLKKIKAEREKLGKKDKPLLSIDEDEIPFQLPAGWAWCRLGEIVGIISGVTLGKSYKGELINTPYLRVANVQRGYVDVTTLKELAITPSDLSKYSLEKGDLVMIEGGDWDKVGRCAIWTHDIAPVIHQNHIYRMRFGDKVKNTWAELFLNSPIGRRYFESCSKQTTNLASINKTQLTNAIFPLPPIAEQQRIVTHVEQLMQQYNRLEQSIQQSQQQVKQLLQAVLREAFEVKEVAELPKEGKIISLNPLNPDIAKKSAPRQAMIIALAMAEHETKEKNLFRTKAEKISHVVECHVLQECGRVPLKMAAGPADFEHLTKIVEPLAAENKWWVIETGHGDKGPWYKYVKGKKFEDCLKAAHLEMADDLDEAMRIISLFTAFKNTREAEVHATVYAAWNNLMLLDEPVTDISILTEARENWTEEKKAIPEEEFLNAIIWLQENDLCPKGQGKYVAKQVA